MPTGVSGDVAATLTIDLGAIVANYRMLAKLVGPAVCGAVVKADAYGLGAAMVAPALQRAGCSQFFVATLDEGLALRPALLPAATIFLLNGLPPGSAAAVAAADLVPILATLGQLDEWRKYCASSAPKPAALQIDTGISRLGLSEADVARLAKDAHLLNGVPLIHVMSHLACADEPAHPLNRQQLNRFRAMTDRLPWPGGKKPSLGLAASSTIFLGADYHFDLIRPGAALYGLEPTIGQPNPMRPVVRLQGKILQVRDVDLGMTVGYGASHQFGGPSRLAVIGVGYADGIFRSLGNRGAVFFAGERAPIVGRISMDLMTVDVGPVPVAACQPGNSVDIIGPQQSVDDLARSAGTIGYEVLTAFGKRYERRYLAATGSAS
ncbi:MAG TPA: alanine racemase [Dongiaceae bacterium]